MRMKEHIARNTSAKFALLFAARYAYAQPAGMAKSTPRIVAARPVLDDAYFHFRH